MGLAKFWLYSHRFKSFSKHYFKYHKFLFREVGGFH